MPRAGQYDQQITIYENVASGQNPFGEDTLNATVVASLWAAVLYLSGRELERVQQTFAEARYRILFGWQPDSVVLKREQYIYWHGQTLDVLDVRGPGTRAAEWEIIAKDHVE